MKTELLETEQRSMNSCILVGNQVEISFLPNIYTIPIKNSNEAEIKNLNIKCFSISSSFSRLK